MKNIIKKKINVLLRYLIQKISLEKFLYYDPLKTWEVEQCNKSYQHFKKYFNNSVLISYTQLIREHAIKKAIEFEVNYPNQEPLYLEFGVYRGESINYFASILKEKKIYGFDSFSGLDFDWVGNINHVAGTFDINSSRELKVFKNTELKFRNNVTIVKGLIQNTLPDFLENIDNKYISFCHIDVDIYETTNTILKNIKRFLKKGSIILFDELYNHPGWEVGEYKALKENFSEQDYDFISFSSKYQAAIRIK